MTTATKQYLNYKTSNEKQEIPIHGYGRLEDEKSFIFLKNGRSFKRVLYQDIIYVKALGSYCLLITSNANFTISASMKSVLKQLDWSEIIKCHRSYAVNLKAIEEFDDMTITLHINEKVVEIPLSGSYRGAVMQHLPRMKSC